jgi:hypothetical protein
LVPVDRSEERGWDAYEEYFAGAGISWTRV